MFEKLSQRDKRTLIFGAVAAAAILAYVYVGPWFKEWRNTKSTLQAKQDLLKAIAPGADDESAKTAHDKLAQVVPVFEMPLPEKKQMPLFRDKFSDQLKKAGIQVKTLRPIGSKSAKRVPGHNVKLLKFQCLGKCSLNQVLDLLAGLNSNPYLAGIEEISLKCDPKDRRKMDLVLTVSTFVR